MIRVVLCDDHPMLRQSLAKALQEHGDIKVVAEAGSAAQLLEVLQHTPADVVVLDISMPGPGIVPLLHRMASTHPRTRSIVLSMHSEAQYAVRVLKAGAAGYVMKEWALEHLVEAVRKAHRGGRFVSPELAERLAAQLHVSGSPATHEQLSDREFDVLRRLAAGASVKEIAARLGISPKTVSTYRARLLEKLGAKTNADLVRYVIQHGLTDT